VSLRLRLVFAFLVLAGGGASLLVRWLVDDLRPRYLESMEEGMVDTATLLSSLVATQARDGVLPVDDLRAAFAEAGRRVFAARIYSLVKNRLDLRVYVVDAKGRMVFDSAGLAKPGDDYSRWRDVALTLRGEYGARSTRADPDDPRTSLLCVGAPVLVDGRIAGALTVCKPADSVTLFMDVARRRTIVSVLWLAAALAIFGAAVSFWVTRPLHRLLDLVRALRDGRRAPAIDHGPPEIRALAAAFTEMVETIEGRRYAERYLQQLVHEMKSPLSSIRGAAELLDEDMPRAQRGAFLATIAGEVRRLQDLVDRQLGLAAVEGRREPRDPVPIALDRLVDEVAAALHPQLAARQLQVARSGAAVVTGEEFLVRQALANLLDNAVAFSPPGGVIEVGIAVAGEVAEVTIDDRGPGVPDYALPRTFERYYSLPRPDGAAKSSGLGLPFVREVALLHGGSAELANRPGGGARAVLRLPMRGHARSI
jgi:two-component system sensor histidine kinase CreC